MNSFAQLIVLPSGLLYCLNLTQAHLSLLSYPSPRLEEINKRRILSATLEFVIGFVSNFYNWCPVSLRTIQWKKRSLYISKWLIYSQYKL